MKEAAERAPGHTLEDGAVQNLGAKVPDEAVQPQMQQGIGDALAAGSKLMDLNMIVQELLVDLTGRRQARDPLLEVTAEQPGECHPSPLDTAHHHPWEDM